MGMTPQREQELARQEAEGRQRAWEGFCELPSPRIAAALRVLLGLSTSRAAMLAGLSEAVLADFERTRAGGFPSHDTARRLHRAYAPLGGGWCAPDLHDGAYCVTLAGTGATDRAAIGAALALMGHRAGSPSRRMGIETLARRVAGPLAMPLAEVRAELGGRAVLSNRVRAEAFRQLGTGRGGAGAYFRPATGGGWAEVGADFEGCRW
jgi:hypothetical protein